MSLETNAMNRLQTAWRSLGALLALDDFAGNEIVAGLAYVSIMRDALVGENSTRTLRSMQASLPWTIRYSRDFRANPQPHKDFAHSIVHVLKAAGKLAALVDDMDHDREVADDPTLRERHAKYLADLVVCALRAANTFPGGVVDLEQAVVDRISSKNAPEKPEVDAARVPACDCPSSCWTDKLFMPSSRCPVHGVDAVKIDRPLAVGERVVGRFSRKLGTVRRTNAAGVYVWFDGDDAEYPQLLHPTLHLERA